MSPLSKCRIPRAERGAPREGADRWRGRPVRRKPADPGVAPRAAPGTPPGPPPPGSPRAAGPYLAELNRRPQMPARPRLLPRSGGCRRVDDPGPAVEFLGEVLPHARVVVGELHDDRHAVRRYGRRIVRQLLRAHRVDMQQAQEDLSAFVVAQRRVTQQLLDGGGRVGGSHGPDARPRGRAGVAGRPIGPGRGGGRDGGRAVTGPDVARRGGRGGGLLWHGRLAALEALAYIEDRRRGDARDAGHVSQRRLRLAGQQFGSPPARAAAIQRADPAIPADPDV